MGILLITAFGVLPPPAFAQGPKKRDTTDTRTRDALVVTGITFPMRRADLGALQPGRISEIPVDEGQAVSNNQLLVQFDDRVQRLRTDIAKASAENGVDVDLERAQAEFAEGELRRLQKLSGESFSSPKELRDAVLAASVARIRHQAAIIRQQQAVREYERNRVVLDQMAIRAPFDGIVTSITRHVGETIDEREDVLTLVQLDPLEAVFVCSITMADHIKKGDRFDVEPVGGRTGRLTGTVLYTPHVADAASQTITVKLRVSNPNRKLMAGTRVVVDFANPQPPATPRTIQSVADRPSLDLGHSEHPTNNSPQG
jgi:membrane fusion protein, multidrug efflux system